MKQKLSFLLAMSFAVAPVLATAEDAIWGGAIYQVGHLEAAAGSNYEAVVTYATDVDGFVALTTNDSGMEVWNSDALGQNWELVESDEFTGCQQPGRHTSITFDNEQYFAATCQDGARIYHVVGLNEFELLYTRTSNAPVVAVDPPPGNGDTGGNEVVNGYPTASALGENFYMFYNGGYTSCTADACTDVTDADGQPSGVPLEATLEVDGLVYLAFTSGEVMSFDGSSYTTIGEDYLESNGDIGTNLPAIGVVGSDVYVGNLDNTNGASIFKYDPDDTDADELLWEEVVQLDAADQIVNKMQTINVNGQEILPFYTANSSTGTNVLMIDDTGELVPLIEAGLGGDNPENNTEVVSIAVRTVNDRGVDKKIQLFASQNRTDQTKIFVLDLGTDVPILVDADSIVEPEESTDTVAAVPAGRRIFAQATRLGRGQVLRVRVNKTELQAGDKVTLYINDKAVQTKTAASGKHVLLTYSKAARRAVGTILRVQVGVKRSYGNGADRQVSNNIVEGNTIRIRIARQ